MVVYGTWQWKLRQMWYWVYRTARKSLVVVPILLPWLEIKRLKEKVRQLEIDYEDLLVGYQEDDE